MFKRERGHTGQPPAANQNWEAAQPDAELGIRARSWNQARNLNNFPSDEQLSDFLDWRSQVDPDTRSYGYLICHENSPEDNQLLDRQLGAAYHYQLANLIGRRLAIQPSPHYNHPPQNRTAIAEAEADYQVQLNEKAHNFWTRATNGDYPPTDDPDFKLDGFCLPIGDERVGLEQPFLLDPAYAANFHISNKSFAVWGSQKQIERILNETEQPCVGRIYLNPTIDRNVEVFDQLIDILDQNEVACDAKIFNRALEAGGNAPRIEHPDGTTTTFSRSEGIVVYVPADEADKTLGLILDYYQQNPQAFAGRAAPPLAAEVAPGIGLATQEGFDGSKKSFNSHRAGIFDQAYQHLQTAEMPAESPPEQKLAAFKYILQEICQREGVDPKNIAFANSRPAAAAGV